MSKKKDDKKQEVKKHINRVSGFKLKKSDKIMFGGKGLIGVIIRADILGREEPSKEMLRFKIDKDEKPKNEKKRGNKVKKMRKGM